MNDVRGKALDLTNAIPANSDFVITGTNDFSMIKKSDIIIISASMIQTVSSRLDSLQKHSQMIKDIAKKIQQYSPESKVLIISNPVDVLTFMFQKYSKINRHNLLGIAGNLDSERFRYLLSQEISKKPSAISNSYVLGEHGDSMVPIFSLAKIDGKPVMQLLNKPAQSKITKRLRDYWKSIRDLGWTSTYGIARNSFDIIEAMTTKKEINTVASINLHGEYGLSNVAMGVPIKIRKDNHVQVSEIDLNSSERLSLTRSAVMIKKFIKNTDSMLVDIHN